MSLCGQTTVAWRGLGSKDQEKRTRHASLRGYVRVLVDYTAVQQERSVTKLNPKYQDRLALAHSPRLFAVRPETVSLGSGVWVLRAGQRTQRVFSRRQTTKTAVGLGACSNLDIHNKSDFPHRKTVCFKLPSSHLKIRLGQNLKLNKRTPLETA